MMRAVFGSMFKGTFGFVNGFGVYLISTVDGLKLIGGILAALVAAATFVSVMLDIVRKVREMRKAK